LPETKPKSGLQKFWGELQRRRVIRVVVVYAVASWLAIGAAETLLPNLNMPDWTVTLVIALVILAFPIVLALAWIFDIGPSGVEKTPAASELRESLPATQPSIAPTASSAIPAALADSSDKRRSIAVLPFVNMSGDRENEYFSDGIAEEILNLLTKLPQLRVASLSLIHI